MEVHARRQPGLFEDRAHDLVGGAGIGRRLEDDEHPGLEVVADGLDRGDDRAEIGAAVLGQRRRHADHDRLGLAQTGGIGRGLEPGLDHFRNVLIGEVIDMGGAGIQAVDDPLGDVEPEHLEADTGGFLSQGQTDIPKTDDGNVN